MALDTWQSDTKWGQYGMLSKRYKDDPNTLVAAGLALYYTKGKPSDMVAPHILVSHGVPDDNRESYKVWEEGKVPDFALELSSPRCARENLGHKKEVYAQIGIPEYCVYDPMGGLHFPRLQLFRLSGGKVGAYEPVRWSDKPDGAQAVPSESLGLELRFQDDELRLWDPAAQEYLWDYVGEAVRWSREHARRLAAERRVRELELELADF